MGGGLPFLGSPLDCHQKHGLVGLPGHGFLVCSCVTQVCQDMAPPWILLLKTRQFFSKISHLVFVIESMKQYLHLIKFNPKVDILIK